MPYCNNKILFSLKYLMHSKLNILFLSSWFPNKNKPTLGNFVETHARAVSLLHNVELIYVVRDSNLKTRFETELRREPNLNISIMYYRASQTPFPFLNKIMDGLRHYVAYKKLYRQLQSKPDLIHANVAWPIGIFALYLKFRNNLKFVLTEHWSIYQRENRHRIKGFKRFMFKKIFSKASMIMPVSYQLQEAIQDTGMKGDFTIVPNAIDINLFKYGEKEWTKDFNFLHISTLEDEVKNISGILRAFRELLRLDSDNYLTIVSDGNLQTAIDYAKELGISKKNIRFVGTQTAEQIVDYFYQNQAFVLFSNYENLPVVILESFATGTPVISTDVGGIKERFPKDFGYLIEAKDEEALLQSMQRMKKNYSIFDREKISKYAKDSFSNSIIAQEYTKVYLKAIIKQ